MAPPRLLHRPARTRLGRRKRVTEEPQARRLGGRRARRLSGSLKSHLQCERSHVQGWSHIPRLCHRLRLHSSGVRGHERRDKVSNPGEGPVWLRARLAICNCLKQLEHVNLQSRCRSWRGAPSPGADVAGASPVAVHMWHGGEPGPGARCGRGCVRSRCRCGRGPPWVAPCPWPP